MGCEDGKHQGSGKHCHRCGERLEQKCKFCNAVLEGHYKHCAGCGSQQDQPQRPVLLDPFTPPVVEPASGAPMPKADVFIPDPPQAISKKDKDKCQQWVMGNLEPVLDLYKISYLTSRHEHFPLTGVKFQLTEQAARNCKFILFPLMAALAGQTFEWLFKEHRKKMIFIRVSDEDEANLFQNILEQHVVIDCKNPGELHQLCAKLYMGIHGIPYYEAVGLAKQRKDSTSVSSSETLSTETSTKPLTESKPLTKQFEDPSSGQHVSPNRKQKSPPCPPKTNVSCPKNSPEPMKPEASGKPGEPQPGPSSLGATDVKNRKQQEVKTENPLNLDTSDDSSTLRGTDVASTCSGSIIEAHPPSEDTRYMSDDVKSLHRKESFNATSMTTPLLHNEQSCMDISPSIQQLCHSSGEDEVKHILEDIAKSEQSVVGMDKILLRGETKDERKENNEMNRSIQMLACHVLPIASRTRKLCVLGKLFIFGGSCPALQLESGYVLCDTVFRMLSQSLQEEDEIRELEDLLRKGLDCLDSALVGLLAEIYKYTVFCILLGYKERPPEKQLLVAMIQTFLKKSSKIHPNKSQFLKFQLGMVQDVLKPEMLSKQMLEILDILGDSAKANQSSKDREQVDVEVARKYRSLKDSERCVMLHYFASAIQNKSTTLTLCKNIFQQELSSAKNRLISKDEKLLFSCAVLFTEMCHFVSRKENIAEIMGDKNPFSSLLKACPRGAICLEQILSPLLFHPEALLRCKVNEALMPTEPNGDLNQERQKSYVEYQRQHLERKLLRFGVILSLADDGGYDYDSRVVTYRGELHTQKVVHRVLCRAPFLCTVADQEELGPDHALFRTMEVLHALNDNQPSGDDDDRHFIQVLLQDQISRPMFVVVDQDWELPTLSQVLLEDLHSTKQRIRLRDMMSIILSIIEATQFAHSKKILLRSFAAESFLVEMRGDGNLKVIFWDVNAARKGEYTHDTGQLSYTGNKQDSSLAILWLAPESILEGYFDLSSQVYSMGMGCYEILCHGIYPYTSHSQLDTTSLIRQTLLYTNLPGRRLGFPMHVYLLILQCLLYNPSKRPTLQAFYDSMNDFMKGLDSEDTEYPASTLNFLKALAESQANHKVVKSLPKEFEHDLKASDIGDRGSELEDQYCAAIQADDPTTICQCADDELKSRHDPRPIPGRNGYFEACITKTTKRDERERAKICELNHKNLPKHIKFGSSRSCVDHTVLQMNVSPYYQDLLSYFLEKQPCPKVRIAFYLQICDVIKYLHENDLILGNLNPEHIMVIDGASLGKQCVMTHLGLLTLLVKKNGELPSDVIVRPFRDKWPQNAARGSPLECNDSGCLSTASDVAMAGMCFLQLESAIGKGKDVPIKYTIPNYYIPAAKLVEAQRCHCYPLQSRFTPDWLYKLCKAMIVNQDFRRPPMADVIGYTNFATGDQHEEDKTTGVITYLKERRCPEGNPQPFPLRDLRTRVAALVYVEEADRFVGGVAIADRGSNEHQSTVRNTVPRRCYQPQLLGKTKRKTGGIYKLMPWTQRNVSGTQDQQTLDGDRSTYYNHQRPDDAMTYEPFQHYQNEMNDSTGATSASSAVDLPPSTHRIPSLLPPPADDMAYEPVQHYQNNLPCPTGATSSSSYYNQPRPFDTLEQNGQPYCSTLERDDATGATSSGFEERQLVPPPHSSEIPPPLPPRDNTADHTAAADDNIHRRADDAQYESRDNIHRRADDAPYESIADSFDYISNSSFSSA